MLGLVATVYYLTATYRQSPRFRDLALALDSRALAPGRRRRRRGRLVWNVRPGMDDRRRSRLFQRAGGRSAAILCSTCSPRMALLGETITAGGTAGARRRSRESADVPPRGRSRRPRSRGTARSSSTRVAGPCSARPRIVKPLSNFIYRAMQVGVLLIAAGTILGGVWADYSWGRFWGWDPKEVWALDHLAGLPDPAPRPVRRLGQHVRAGRGLGRLLPVGHHGLVRRELRAGRRAAQLRLRRRGLAGNHERDHHGRARSPGRRRLAPVLGTAPQVDGGESSPIQPEVMIADRSRSETRRPAIPAYRRAASRGGSAATCRQRSAHSSRFNPS